MTSCIKVKPRQREKSQGQYAILKARCEYWQGCHEWATTLCFLPGNETDEPDELLCSEHVTKSGYCWGCGLFWAGVESFDFSTNGLCDNCRHDPDLTGEWDDEREEYEDHDSNYPDELDEPLRALT